MQQRLLAFIVDLLIVAVALTAIIVYVEHTAIQRMGTVRDEKGVHRTLRTAMEEDLGDKKGRSDTPAINPHTKRKHTLLPVARQVQVRENRNVVATCSGGFVAHDNYHNPYLVIAGHCATRDEGVVENRSVSGKRFTNAVFTKEDNSIDYALVPTHLDNVYSTGKFPGEGDTVPITGVQEPQIGLEVCSWGSTTGWRCGRIIELKENHGFVTDYSSNPGDSGGIIVAGDKVVGITTASITGKRTSKLLNKKVTTRRSYGMSAQYIVHETGLHVSND